MSKKANTSALTPMRNSDLRKVAAIFKNCNDRAGLTSRQRRRLKSVTQRLARLLSGETNEIVSIDETLFRHLLWGLAIVPKFLRKDVRFINGTQDGKK